MFVRMPKRHQMGFTLIEMMIVLLIAGVVLALSGPSMARLLQKNRLQSAAGNFYGDLMLARSEAIKRNQPVVLCKSSSGTACVVAGNWEQGWMSFVDQDADGALDVGEPILHVAKALNNGDTLRATGTAFDDQLIYRTDGSSSGIAGNETFVFCDADKELINAREILVTLTGRPRRQMKTTGTCPV